MFVSHFSLHKPCLLAKWTVWSTQHVSPIPSLSCYFLCLESLLGLSPTYYNTGSHFRPSSASISPNSCIFNLPLFFSPDFYGAYCLSSQMTLTTHHVILLFVLKVFPLFSNRLYFAWGPESFLVSLSIPGSPESELAHFRNSVAARCCCKCCCLSS